MTRMTRVTEMTEKMKIYWCSWTAPDNVPQEQCARQWPDNVMAWCSARRQEYNVFCGVVIAKNAAEADALYRSCYGKSAHTVKNQWVPMEKPDSTIWGCLVGNTKGRQSSRMEWAKKRMKALNGDLLGTTYTVSRPDEIRARWAATTPGPWEHFGASAAEPGEDEWGRVCKFPNHLVCALRDGRRQGDAVDPIAADAEAITRAPEDIAWLLTEVTRLTALSEKDLSC